MQGRAREAQRILPELDKSVGPFPIYFLPAPSLKTAVGYLKESPPFLHSPRSDRKKVPWTPAFLLFFSPKTHPRNSWLEARLAVLSPPSPPQPLPDTHLSNTYAQIAVDKYLMCAASGERDGFI